jgi:hypothetical protein
LSSPWPYLRIFFVVSLLGGGIGAFLLVWPRSPKPIPLMHLSTIERSLRGLHPTPPEDLCRAMREENLHGAFRELDCLITIRRAFPKDGAVLDPLLLRKLRQIHQRLRHESVDWRTVARWKYLYMLGARLYPVQNEQAQRAPIPVYEVNGHHLAVPFWIKESQRREVGPLFHLDTHNEMRAVPSPTHVLRAVANLKRGVKIKEAWHTLSHAIYDCAMPVAGGVLAANYQRVIWGKPSWNGYPEFVNRRFFFARPKDKTPTALPDPRWSAKKKKRKETDLKEYEKKRSHFRLYYDPQMEPDREIIPSGDAWVTIQPAQRPVDQKFELIRPFWLSILTTDLPLDEKGQGKGASMFQQLLQTIPKGRFTLDLDLDYFASIDSTEGFKRTAGSDPEWDQDLFKKRRALLKPRLAQFRSMLIALKAKGRIPSIITIADSTYMTFALDPEAQGQSEYTPIEHTAHLRQAVRDIFKDVYGKEIEPAPVSPTKYPASQPTKKKARNPKKTR